jgi:hypothetical protein
MTVAQETSATAGAQFLMAADNNDFTKMATLVSKVVDMGRTISFAQFMKKIEPCYLRRVYRNDQSKEVTAAWMCAEGEAKSRVVLAQLASMGDSVVVSVVREDRNRIAAPPKKGSAFAEEQK